MRILLIDDHPLFRQALATTIANIRGDIAPEQHDSLAGACAALERDRDAALILLDLKLPDSEGAMGLLSLKARFADIPIAIISANDDEEMVQTALVCGAAAFISKASGIPELTAAVETLLEGETWFPHHAGATQHDPLSRTQARVLEGVHRGLMNKQIAFELGLSEATVKYHLTGLFRKFGATSRSQLVALARYRLPQS